jgi:hypothetical protein
MTKRYFMFTNLEDQSSINRLKYVPIYILAIVVYAGVAGTLSSNFELLLELVDTISLILIALVLLLRKKTTKDLNFHLLLAFAGSPIW